MNFFSYIMAGGFICLVLAVASTPATANEPLRVRPGADLQEAINAAPEGATLILEPGNHQGPLVIVHRITLRGMPNAHLRGTGKGTVLTIEADGVRVESLGISGSGHSLSTDDAGVTVLGNHVHLANLQLRDNLHGIYVRRASHVTLVHNTVAGFAATKTDQPVVVDSAPTHSDDIHHNPPGVQALMGNGLHLWNAKQATVESNHVHHVRDGIYVAHTSESVFRGNRIHDARYGIHYMYSSNNAVEGNHLWNNVAGPALMFSCDLVVKDNILRDHSGFRAYGMLLQNIETSNFHNNEIRGNRVGMRLQNSGANTFNGNRIFGNVAGMTINSSSRDNAFTRNVIGLNLHQVELTGPAPHTRWSVDGVGNRWHGSMPLDLTGDGIAEWPHHEVDLMAERRERFPYVQLLAGSPGIRAMEWALKRAPVPGLRHIIDPHPLTRGVDQ